MPRGRPKRLRRKLSFVADTETETKAVKSKSSENTKTSQKLKAEVVGEESTAIDTTMTAKVTKVLEAIEQESTQKKKGTAVKRKAQDDRPEEKELPTKRARISFVQKNEKQVIDKQTNDKQISEENKPKTPPQKKDKEEIERTPPNGIREINFKDQLAKKPLNSALSPFSKKKAQNKEKTSKSVNFSDVQIRFHNRRHGGSGGIPSSGGFPLGLDWTISGEMKSPVHVYEKKRSEEKKSTDFEPLSEIERKQLLEEFDDRPAMARMVSYMDRKEELNVLRKARKSETGCHCQISSEGKIESSVPWWLQNASIQSKTQNSKKQRTCVSETCQCFLAGVECLEGLCSCERCGNPKNL